MNAPRGVVDVQLEALLGIVAKRRDGQCREILDQAETHARHLLAEAHREARQRMRRAVEQERQRARERLTEAHARLQTRARREQYRIALTMLAEGWDSLRDALLGRWREDKSRAAWTGALIEQALQVLPCRPWTIEHPAGWNPEEIRPDFERLRTHCGTPPRFLPRGEIRAGLRFCTDGACLDGTHEGLLTDRNGIEGRLLAGFHRLLGGNGVGLPEMPAPDMPKEGGKP